MWEKGRYTTEKRIGKGGLLSNGNETTVRDRSCTHRQSLGRRGVPGQLWKAAPPMSTGPAGSVISLRDVHPKKADCPISVRLGGSVILAKDLHL